MKKSALDTPMMKQYIAIKAGHPDAIVFYRMGDFYEMFLDDAELVAPLLDIALTSRDKGKTDPVPMCGVPVHSAEQYIRQLAGLGHRVAICEQVEDPGPLAGRRLVKREVVEVVTPGLVGDPTGIEGQVEVSLVALAQPSAGAENWALAALDASTGDFRATATCVDAEAGATELPRNLLEELQRVAPRELLLDSHLHETLAGSFLLALPETTLTRISAEDYDPESVPACPEGFEACPDGSAKRAASALLGYLGRNQPFALAHAPRLRYYELGTTVTLDISTRMHLELFENNEDRGRKGSLISVLDLTRTAMGARKLGRWVAYPLRSPESIQRRQEAVAFLASSDRRRGRLREALAEVRDLERILVQAARPGAFPRDLGRLRASLQGLPGVASAVLSEERELFEREASERSEMPAGIVVPTTLPKLADLLENGLIDDPPAIARGSRGANESGYIRPGYRSDLDEVHRGAREGRDWIAGLEASERVRTGIPSLKVRYHPVHGYSLEVSKSQLAKVPADYERKQTLANVERYTTEALREVEAKVMGASERAAALEREILEALRQTVVRAAESIRLSADAVADLDALASLAEVARRGAWIRPEINDRERIRIVGGRHPVVEAGLRSQGSDGFVPNDTDLDCGATRLLLLTGPNMSGKSTYLRQVALIVLLAQIGSFVPAEKATIGVVDRIFTRVGASDRLSRGESTFMVEMRETAEILALASRRSLIILDEIGRGTSTFDGLSIAWAVAEYLHDTPGLKARTLFATHYHELIELARMLPHIANAHFEVREWKDEVVFLRRPVEGGANRSYGIQVAQLAGLPAPVIQRAREVLRDLEETDQSHSTDRDASTRADPQLALALGGDSNSHRPGQTEILEEIESLDPDAMTPLDALLAIGRWKTQLGGEE